MERLRTPRTILAGLAILALAFLLAWVSSGFAGVAGWGSFLAVILLGAAGLWGGWRLLKSESPPGWLGWLVLGAALLRLGLGVFWQIGLPLWGYDTPVQQAGYVMEDAYNRDQDAWALAGSETPLWEAFRGLSIRDQYGGLLFLSGFVYRYLGGAEHLPLMMVVLTAAFSALAVAFTWAATRRLWGEKTAKMAAWILALYPETALLGSSQMREGFMVTLVMAALYGLLRWREAKSWREGLWVLVPVLVSVPLSWPFALMLAAALGLITLALDEWRLLRQRRFWIGFGLALGAAILLIWKFVDFEELQLIEAGRWQAYFSLQESGWIQRLITKGYVPTWAQIPFQVSYGVFRPLLPAALIADGALLWRLVAIWRALGWTVMLALLLYATFLALRKDKGGRLTGVLLLITWLVIVGASYRGGGDYWDNPRYRSAFAGIQAALVAWALIKQRETKDPWLRRGIGATVMVILWFIPWYLRRYTGFTWPIVEISQTVGLGLASGALYVIWDWTR